MKTFATGVAAFLLLPFAALADPFEKGGWEPLAEIALEQSTVGLEIGSTDPIRLAELESPPVTAHRYLVAGEIRYTDASGFLEMWNVFGDQRYFSRTLGEVGPMAKLAGTSDWRPFMLPFNADSGGLPDRLEINVVLPGGGKVELRGLRLYQTEAALRPPGALREKAMWIGCGVVILALGIAYARRIRARRELRKMTAADLS